MEPGKATAEKNGAGDVVLEMSKLEEAFVSNKEGENPNALSSVPKSSFSMNFIVGSSPKNLELAAQQENIRYRGQVLNVESSSSTKEIASPKPDKPSPSQKKHLAKSSFSKSKSRLIEPNSRSSGSSKYSTENSKSGEEDEDDEENPEIEASKKSAIWLLKTLFVKVIAANFQGKRFFDRIKEAIFHQHVLEVLSLTESSSRAKSTSIAYITRRKTEKVIKWLKNTKKEKASAWTMKGFIDVISGSKLSFAEDEDNDHRQKDKKITSELKVKQAANKLFKKLAKSDNKCIQKKDLLSYFDEKELDEDVLPLFKGAPEKDEIKKKALKDWMLEVYRERKSLLLLVVFMFGNTFRTVFEAIIFVFVMHPFDVSDRCIIDGAQMIVEEVNLLTTVFLKFDNEKVYYPNSVLATKPIGNFYRSPEMGDSVEFAIDVSTSVEQIKALKVKIKEYLENNPETWHSEHSVVVKDFDDVNKIKMVLFVKHTINFQNYADKNNRRSDLILELKTILEDLRIKYHMLPLQAHLIGSQFPPTTR
ncbi:hypothetical protein SLA2020_525220 [Shorea laevis]